MNRQLKKLFASHHLIAGRVTINTPVLTTYNQQPEIWLLSAYNTDSHAHWADWLTNTFDRFRWKRLELPGRRFRWRIRGNPVSWLDRLPEGEPDLILATSMVDLATIKGLHPRLAHTRCWYYFHENQFAYPLSEHQFNQIDPQMVQLYGALAAEKLFFNSEFNRRSFLEGVFELLRTKPQADSMGIRGKLKDKSNILPVPVTPIASGEHNVPALVLWNHRWEYDKAPEVFARALLQLEQTVRVPYQLALLGDRSHAYPNEHLQVIRDRLAHRILADGRLDRLDYEQLVGRACIVVSTALHEFQGLSMLEATSAGAVPLAPDALCYPEQYPAGCLYPASDEQALAGRLKQWLEDGLPPPPDVSAYTGEELHRRWTELFNGLTER